MSSLSLVSLNYHAELNFRMLVSVTLRRIRDITDHGQNGPRTKRTTAGQNGPRQGQNGPCFKTKRTMFKDKTDHAWDNQTI